MARINLLPWREEQRRDRQRQFLVTMLVTSVLGVVLVFMIGVAYEQKIQHQQSRNQLVQQEIRQLEIRIRKIDELERTRSRLISRKQVIERLQASRSMTVELLDNLARTIPVGVTLSTVRQQGSTLALGGNSQSNARVSAYLKELEVNDLFINLQLDYVRSSPRAGSTTEPYQFSIRVNLRPPGVDKSEPGTDQGDEGGTG